MLPTSVQWGVAIITIVSRSILSTIVALLLWSVLPNLVGFQTTTVMSGSMEPRLQVGDAIIVRHLDAAHLAKGQVLLFDDPDVPGRLRMHRLVEIRSDGQLVTKGDANRNRDSSTVGIDAVHGAAFLRIPYAGLPNYWLKTDQPLPLVGGAVLVLVLMSGIRLGRLLEDEQERERRRHRGVRLPGLHRAVTAGAVLVVLSGVLVAPAEPARAAYSGTTANGTNSWLTACGDRTPTNLGSSPQLYWGYGTMPASDVSDLSGQGDTGTSPTGSDATVLGCTGGLTPAIQVGGTSKGLIVEKTSHAFPGATTIATWFKTTTAGGVLADFGGSASVSSPSSSGNIDRVLYMQSDGNLSFGAITSTVAGLLGSPIYCTTAKAGGWADNTWHLAVATYSYSAGCTLTVDSNAPVSTPAPNLSLNILGNYSGYWRFGYDAVTSANWTGATARQAFQGYLDETQVYNAILDPTARATILTRGH